MTKFVTFDNGRSYYNVSTIESFENAGTPEKPRTNLVFEAGFEVAVALPPEEVVRRLGEFVMLDEAQED